MKKLAFFLTLLAATRAMSQTPARDPDALQALLNEVHQLRQDIEAMTVASQRVQIALYGLQMQDAVVARAAKRLDDAREKRATSEGIRDHMTSEIQRLEAATTSATATPDERKSVQERLPMMKTELERSTAEFQTRQAAEAEAASQFQTEQAKMAELQDRIQKLDKALEQMTGPSR